jgi:hypothetical protein
MYHTGKNPLRRLGPASEAVSVVRGERRRRIHKAFLRYHDPANWPLLREALRQMGRADLIGNGKHQLVPRFQPRSLGSPSSPEGKRGAKGKHKPFRTQHVR